MSVFRLTMLPAAEGDCLILSYGESEAVLRHVLIDGGRKATWPKLQGALAAIAARGEQIELMVLSHIDADHIDGLLKMAEADPGAIPLIPKAVWFNGFEQIAPLLPGSDLEGFGFPAAEAWSTALAAKGWPLNAEFGGKAIAVEKRPQPFDFAGLTLTLLSPGTAKLAKLARDWSKFLGTGGTAAESGEPAVPPGLEPMGREAEPVLEAFGKRPFPDVLDVEALLAPSDLDDTVPNGSSIAFIAEFAGKRVLLGADAHADQLVATLAANAEATTGGSCWFDLVKLPHHGSRGNVNREMIELIACRRFAISTSGVQFGHPDPETIARILKFGQPGTKTFWFNYASDRTIPWTDPALVAQWDYECIFPPAGADMPTVIDI